MKRTLIWIAIIFLAIMYTIIVYGWWQEGDANQKLQQSEQEYELIKMFHYEGVLQNHKPLSYN